MRKIGVNYFPLIGSVSTISKMKQCLQHAKELREMGYGRLVLFSDKAGEIFVDRHVPQMYVNEAGDKCLQMTLTGAAKELIEPLHVAGFRLHAHILSVAWLKVAAENGISEINQHKNGDWVDSRSPIRPYIDGLAAGIRPQGDWILHESKWPLPDADAIINHMGSLPQAILINEHQAKRAPSIGTQHTKEWNARIEWFRQHGIRMQVKFTGTGHAVQPAFWSTFMGKLARVGGFPWISPLDKDKHDAVLNHWLPVYRRTFEANW